MIRQAYFKKLQNGFQRFKNKTGSGKQGGNKRKTLFGKICSKRLRQVFMKWKWAHDRAELLDDQYYCGPSRAENWEAEREISNL